MIRTYQKQTRLRSSSKNIQKNYTKNTLMTWTTKMWSPTQSQTSLRSITTNKVSRGDRIPAELLQILKDDDVKVLHSIYQQVWKIQQRPQDWKKSVFISIPKKGIPDYLTCLLRNLYEGQEVTDPHKEQLTGSKLGKEYEKAVYRHLVDLTYICQAG